VSPAANARIFLATFAQTPALDRIDPLFFQLRPHLKFIGIVGHMEHCEILHRPSELTLGMIIQDRQMLVDAADDLGVAASPKYGRSLGVGD
jgi:hypothetical protein